MSDDSLSPEEHYIQAGAMLRAVEAELPKLKEGYDESQSMEWIMAMTEVAKVHAQLAGIYTPTPLHLIPGTSVPAFDTYNDDDAEDDRP